MVTDDKITAGGLLRFLMRRKRRNAHARKIEKSEMWN